MKDPILTITITNYNYERYITQAIESVLSQTFEDFEVIIVDNASTDKSVQIICGFAERDPRIRLIQNETNQGLAFSLRKACAEARGRYRVHLDADDWVVNPEAFAIQVDLLERHADVVMVASPVLYYDDAGCRETLEVYPDNTIEPGEKAIEKALFFRLSHSGTMIRMAAYRACGGYDTEFLHDLDAKLWVDLCPQGALAYTKEHLYAWRQHGNNLSSTKTFGHQVREHMRLLESALRGPLQNKIAHPEKIRRDFTCYVLSSRPSRTIFQGNYLKGLQFYMVSIGIDPINSIFQRRTIDVILRILLGQNGFRLLTSLAQR